MKVVVIAAFLFLTGCTTTDQLVRTYDQPGWPGYISQEVSEFDDRKTISMVPAYLKSGQSSLRLGLRWHSELEKNKLIIIAEWSGAKNFSPNSPLKFRADGEYISLQPVNKSQYGVVSQKTVISKGGLLEVPVNLGNHTTKQYWISVNELQQIIGSEKVVVRAELLDTYWEEVMEPNQKDISTYNKYPYIWAKAGFQRFLESSEFTAI